MVYLIKLCFIAFTMFAANVFAINSMPLDSAADNYIEQFGADALCIAFRHGNHQIVADLLEKGELEKCNAPIEMGLQLEGNEVLLALFNAFKWEKKLNISELIQVLRVFKSEPRKIDEYGDCEPVVSIRYSNGNLNFSALPQDLAKKVAEIFGIFP